MPLLCARFFVGQSFGFASELPLGLELALLQMNHREFLVNHVGWKGAAGVSTR